MATDIAYNENRHTEWTETGDLKLVTDGEQIRQAISTSIIEITPQLSFDISPTGLAEMEGDIKTAVRQNSFSIPPYDVSVSSYDRDERSIQFDITTGNVEMSQTLVL